MVILLYSVIFCLIFNTQNTYIIVYLWVMQIITPPPIKSRVLTIILPLIFPSGLGNDYQCWNKISRKLSNRLILLYIIVYLDLKKDKSNLLSKIVIFFKCTKFNKSILSALNFLSPLNLFNVYVLQICLKNINNSVTN